MQNIIHFFSFDFGVKCDLVISVDKDTQRWLRKNVGDEFPETFGILLWMNRRYFSTSLKGRKRMSHVIITSHISELYWTSAH